MLYHRDNFPGAKLSTLGVNSAVFPKSYTSPALEMRQIFSVHLGHALFSFSGFHTPDQNS